VAKERGAFLYFFIHFYLIGLIQSINFPFFCFVNDFHE
jgi:hypothetical protein